MTLTEHLKNETQNRVGVTYFSPVNVDHVFLDLIYADIKKISVDREQMNTIVLYCLRSLPATNVMNEAANTGLVKKFMGVELELLEQID